MSSPPFDIATMLALANRITPAALATYLTSGYPDSSRFQCPPHIKLISLKLADAVAGRCPRLIISCPPRHGKSLLCSQYFPIWVLENFPRHRIILASYEADFAASWGRKVRDTILEHEKKLSVRISASSGAADFWETKQGGGMMTAGVGGAVTGKGADCLLVDDPIRNAEDSNSPAHQERLWSWWQSTAYTRLEPGGCAIVIQTRWHPLDLAGRIISEMKAGGERWEVINLPALAESDDPLGRQVGEPLWPERYDRAALNNIKRAVGGYVWSALYQGRPTAPEGNYFKRNWFDVIDRKEVPPRMKLCRFWDLAGTVPGEKGNYDPDYTVGVKMGLSSAGVAYVLDVVRVRLSPDNVQRLVQKCAKQDGPECRVRMQQDPGQAGKEQVRSYGKLLTGYDFRGLIRTVDKVVSTGPFNAACERGDVKLARAEWNDEFISELTAFPNAAHDDAVDAVTGAFTDLTGTSQSWDQDSMKKAFSYNQSKDQNVLERLGYRQATADVN